MNKFYSMVGMARKSGNIMFGFDTTISFIKNNNKILVILANDASEKTKKNVIFECDKYGCKYIEYGEKDIYGSILNKKAVSVLAVTDVNMISYLLKNQ